VNPGRELDRLVAEKVMGWKRMSYHQTQPTNKYYMDRHELTFWWYDKNGREVFLAESSDCIDCGTDIPAWSPSTRTDHAWEVVEKLRDDNFSIEENGTHWKARFGGKWRGAETAPHAICLAALEVVDQSIQP
jgi:hypothetical protein